MSVDNRLIENLESVRQRMADAAARSGRSADQIALVAVTKYVDAQMAAQLHAAGCNDLGENRPQALWDKAEQLKHLPITWHMIGHVQRNKVKRTLEYSHFVHSVDSLRLMRAIQQQANSTNSAVDVLLEVNVSGEQAKQGFDPATLSQEFGDICTACQGENMTLRGLMCMSGLHSDDDHKRREFATLRELRDRLAREHPDETNFTDLSMGMSADFEVAIEEGATIVRVGTVLFEGIL